MGEIIFFTGLFVTYLPVPSARIIGVVVMAVGVAIMWFYQFRSQPR